MRNTYGKQSSFNRVAYGIHVVKPYKQNKHYQYAKLKCDKTIARG